MKYRFLFLVFLIPFIYAQPSIDYNDISDKTVVIRLEPQPKMPNFLKTMDPPKTIETPKTTAPINSQMTQISNQQTMQRLQETSQFTGNPVKMMNSENIQQPQQKVNQQSIQLPPLQQNQQSIHNNQPGISSSVPVLPPGNFKI